MFDDFSGSIDPYWIQVCTGGGTLTTTKSTLRIAFDSAEEGKYTDAQIDDYTMLPRSAYPWKPPLRMTVRARFSGFLKGTAGFGFWNNPFSVKGHILALPEAIWCFYASPPSNMTLVPNIPGWGWKAQIIHTKRPGSLAVTIPMSATAVYALLTGEMKPAFSWMQKLAGAHEALLQVRMTSWHTYTLEWRRNQAAFFLDGKLILDAPQPPAGPLGFVAWVDNQYAIATPPCVLRFGKVKSGPQWLEIDSVKIEQLKHI